MKNSLLQLAAMIALTESTIAPQEKRPFNEPKEDKQVIPKGLKLFQFPGFECYALNIKTARKKYDKFLNSQQKQ